MAKENREHKSTVFTDLFYEDQDAKENLLSLSNALFDTNYTDPGIIQLVRLEDVLFKNFKNDVAFTVNEQKIILTEHQSTVNPNLPIRDLMYVAREYEKLLPIRKRYSSSLIKLPRPQFITFYNGNEDRPSEEILRLSDAFKTSTDGINSIALELTVRVININLEKHHPLLQKCTILNEYSQFISIVKQMISKSWPLENAEKNVSDEAS